MSEYISTVPECFPKEETDPSIAEGKFDVSFAEYKYHFEVVGQSVVVHCMKTIHIFLSALWESALVFWG